MAIVSTKVNFDFFLNSNNNFAMPEVGAIEEYMY